MEKLITVTKKQVDKFIKDKKSLFVDMKEFLSEVNKTLIELDKYNDPLSGRRNSPNQYKFYHRVKKRLEYLINNTQTQSDVAIKLDYWERRKKAMELAQMDNQSMVGYETHESY